MARIQLVDALPEPIAEDKPKTTPRKATKAPRKPAAKEPATEAPVILGVSSKEAERVTLYLHPQDVEFLQYGIQGGSMQAVVRTMIALTRADPKLRETVAQLSRKAPRGSQEK